MNEQIRKLFDQALAEFTAENKHATVVVPDPVQRDFVEKFAELIVRECMAQCAKVEADDELSNYEGGFRDGALLCYQEIKEHFGVE